MRSKHLLFLFIALYGLWGCSSNSRKFTVVGDIKGMPEQTVWLEQRNLNEINVIVDSQHTTADGHFELSGIAPEPGMYRLHFHPNKYILLSVDKGNIKITGDWNSLENYTVAGSAPSEQLRKFMVVFRQNENDFKTMMLVLDTLQARGNDSILAVATKDYENMKQHFTHIIENYADTTPYEPNAIFAARILNPASEGSYLEEFTHQLARRFPGTQMSRDFTAYYNRVSERHPQAAPQPATADAGEIAQDIKLPGTDGNIVALSSYKGKYVLLDFWASWCGPCRGESPYLVEAYKRFKDKNFAIYSVSLDNNKEAWQRAIKDDNFTWTQVSDLRGWASEAAKLYGIQSIPTNYLIDPKGKIIARNLRGNQLQDILQNIFKMQAN